MLNTLVALSIVSATSAVASLGHQSVVHPHFLSQASKHTSGRFSNWGNEDVLPDLRNRIISGASVKRAVDYSGASTEGIFTTLTHDAYPKHSVRVKKSKFCDGHVDAYTGYIDVEARHLFFYFFESRNDPDKDDVMFWTNGGPGGSSALGLFLELGPCKIKDGNSTTYNPYSWNEKANIMFVDQPVGVGFSYADHGETVTSTTDAAVDIAALMFIFFEHFEKFKGRPLHMAGESYGGIYIPIFSSAIYDLNVRLIEGQQTPINLASAMIGNGLTDFYHWLTSAYDAQCTPAVLSPPVQTISMCIAMKQALPRCQQQFRDSCISKLDPIDCQAAISFCQANIGAPYTALNRNPYNIAEYCDDYDGTLCYPQTLDVEAYLSSPTTKRVLGVEKDFPGNFTLLNLDLNLAFWARLDAVPGVTAYVTSLLERGVRVLVYVGDYDFVCNLVGVERWTRELEWSGGEQFAKTELRTWEVDGAPAGKTKSYGNFTFATIHAAGHLAPRDKPKESLSLVQRWLAGEGL